MSRSTSAVLRAARGVLAGCVVSAVLLAGAGSATAAPTAPAAPATVAAAADATGRVVHDGRIVAYETSGAYSPDGYQWAEIRRHATYSPSQGSVHVTIAPQEYQYKWGGFWYYNKYMTSTESTASLVKNGVIVDRIRASSKNTSRTGASAIGNLSLGKHGAGQYCVVLETQIGGMYWSSPYARTGSDISSSRTYCFNR